MHGSIVGTFPGLSSTSLRGFTSLGMATTVLANGSFCCDKITGHKGDVNWCTFSPVKRHLVTTSGDKTVRVWDTSTKGTPTELHVLRGHKYYVNCAEFTPIGDLLCTGSSDFSVKLWSTESYSEIGNYINVLMKYFGCGFA